MAGLAVVLLVGWLAFGAAPTSAQAEPDSAELRQFRLADQYMRAGQYERAIPVLEDLYASAPENSTFYVKLKEAYENVKKYDEAIALVEKRIERFDTPMLMSEKARLQYLAGREKAAFETWDRALSLSPQRSSTYRIVYQALVDIRRFDRAIEVLKQGREALSDSSLFRLQLAYLYSLAGRHREAMTEYVELLENDPDRVSFVRNRLSAFVEQGEELGESIGVLEEAVREAPLNRAYRELLAWLHMEEDDYRAAFDVYRAIDRLEKENGQTLYQFARQAADADAYEVASDAYEEILSRHPDSPFAPEAQRGLGDMHRRWAQQTDERVFDPSGERIEAPHYEAALQAYKTFLETYPNHRAYADVLRSVAALQQDVFRRLDAARKTLERVVARAPGSEAANEARYDLGRIQLQDGNLQEARLTFSRLVDRVRTGDLADRARYEMALLHFYDGEFESAQTRLEAVNQNTSSDVANDALELTVMIRFNKGPDSTSRPLRRYAEARLLDRQRRFDAAIASLDSLLSQHGNHSIADEARFERASVLRAQGRLESAATAFAELPLIHPRSSLADDALFAAGKAYQRLGNVQKAVDTYNRLLEDHPASILAADTRTRLRRLSTREGS